MTNETHLEIGDLVRIERNFRYTKPVSGSQYFSLGIGLVVSIEDRSTTMDQPQLVWLEYTVLWSETGKKTKHFIGQLNKISGEEIWRE
tara:strand:+ start:59 stop:322 length:264 start_codon:yes stop_codon:yes gene_type:complete